VKSYIVRIYRCEKPCSFVGVVEEVGNRGKKAFKNLDELWEILTSPNKKILGMNSDMEKPK
jgi:hypothetical protein